MPYVYTFLAGAAAGAFAFYYVGKSMLAKKVEGELSKLGTMASSDARTLVDNVRKHL